MTKPVNDHERFMHKATTRRVVMINSLLVGLIGFGHAVADTANTTQPTWPPASQSASGFVPPPPGPYGVAPAPAASTPGFAPPPSTTGMTREEFMAQRDNHRKAMQEQMQQQRAQHQQQAPGVNTPMSREEMDKRWEQMRAEHEKRMQEAMAAKPMSPEDMQKQMEAMRSEREQQMAAQMPKEMQERMAESRKRHEAQYEAMQAKEAELRKLLDQVHAKQLEMQQMLSGMNQAPGGANPPAAPAATFRPAEQAEDTAEASSPTASTPAQQPQPSYPGYPLQRPVMPYGQAYGYPPAPYGYYNRAPLPAYR